LNKNYGTCVENSYRVNDRILVVRIKTAPVNSIIIQVYFPMTNSDEEEKIGRANILEELIERIHYKDNLVIMGYFNAVVGNIANSDTVGKYGLGTRTREGTN